MMNRQVLSVAVIATAMSLTANAISDQCHKECLSFCTYYYPSDECVATCQCPEFTTRVPLVNQQRLMQMSKQASELGATYTEGQSAADSTAI